jgi:hypothetical protein
MRYFGNVIHLAVEEVLANWRVCTSLSILSHNLPVNNKTSTLRISGKEFAKVVAVYVYKIYDKF